MPDETLHGVEPAHTDPVEDEPEPLDIDTPPTEANSDEPPGADDSGSDEGTEHLERDDHATAEVPGEDNDGEA